MAGTATQASQYIYGGLQSAGVVGATLGANSAIERGTGFKPSNIFPGIGQSLLYGTFGQPIARGLSAGYSGYSGMLGYRGLMRGVEHSGSIARYATPGALVSHSIQGSAKLAVGLFGEHITNPKILAATQINKYGLSGVLSATTDEMTYAGARKFFTKTTAGKVSAFLGGDGFSKKGLDFLNSNVNAPRVSKIPKNLKNMTFKQVVPGDDMFRGITKTINGTKVGMANINRSSSLYGSLFKTGRIASVGMRMANVANIMYTAFQVSSFVANRAASNIMPTVERATQQLKEIQHLNMGIDLQQTFRTNSAATERQRAMASMHRSKIAPANQVMGNEAAMLH